MKLDERLHQARGWLDDAAAHGAPDLADLDRRQRHGRIGRAMVLSFALIGIGAGGLGYALNRDDTSTTVAAVASQPNPAQDSTSQVPEPSEEPAYVLTDPPAGWEETAPADTGADHSPALLGEEFSQVFVRFDSEQDSFSAHDGNLTGTIRVSVGTYDDTLRDLFAGPSTRVTVSGREFELVESNVAGSEQLVLVPVDLSERTFVLTARGVDSDVILSVAEPVDPTQPIPRIGDVPDEFTVLYSGPAEFATLSSGTAVSYRNEVGDQSLTVTTFSNVAISCFSNAWAYADTEITQIGGDAGVLAQLEGEPDGVGTYRALWNRGDHALIGIVASGIDRAQLIELADHLTLDDNASGFKSHLALVP